ncbi:MAG: hypothetical protein AAF337_15370 [Pseudomonadota bacterium]
MCTPFAASAQDCFTQPQMRAMTIALADLATEKVIEHCSSFDRDGKYYLSRNKDALASYMDDLRPGANAVLIDKFAPFMKSRPEMAVSVVNPILSTIINEFAVSDLDADACLQTDILLESLHGLQAEQTADLLTVFMRRQAEADPNEDWFKACPAATP